VNVYLGAANSMILHKHVMRWSLETTSYLGQPVKLGKNSTYRKSEYTWTNRSTVGKMSMSQ